MRPPCTPSSASFDVRSSHESVGRFYQVIDTRLPAIRFVEAARLSSTELTDALGLVRAEWARRI